MIEEHYDRKTRTSLAVARAIKQGKAVVVIHGVDYNNNGRYDFGSAGASELDPKLPAEATDPAACGVLKRWSGRTEQQQWPPEWVLGGRWLHRRAWHVRT